MANLSVRKLDRKAYERLRVRAANHGVSMEEEARQIIYAAVAAPIKISSVFQKYFGHERGINLPDTDRDTPHEPMDFNE